MKIGNMNDVDLLLKTFDRKFIPGDSEVLSLDKAVDDVT